MVLRFLHGLTNKSRVQVKGNSGLHRERSRDFSLLQPRAILIRTFVEFNMPHTIVCCWFRFRPIDTIQCPRDGIPARSSSYKIRVSNREKIKKFIDKCDICLIYLSVEFLFEEKIRQSKRDIRTVLVVGARIVL